MKIDIGGQKGRNHFGGQRWETVDIRKDADYQIDIMNDKLPFEDNSIEAVYTSHTLEHIFPDILPFVLSEFSRVLKKGCKVRIVVPDIDKAIKAYIKDDTKYLKDSRNPTKLPCLPDMAICYLSSWFFSYKEDAKTHERLIGGHVNVFNFELLKYYMEKAGFKNIERKSLNDCSDEFKNHDHDRYKDCSIYTEGVK